MSKLHTDDDFDHAMRDGYKQAVQHVSPATRAQLRANRHAATRGDSMSRRGWALGAAFGGLAAATFAIVFTLNVNVDPDLIDDGMQHGPQATSDMLAVASADMPLVTALDQDPDFYAWLTSSDAQLLATE